MDMAEISSNRRFELGVLFVHGIGQQKKGDTLVRFGEPLVRCIQDRFVHGKAASEIGMEDAGRVEIRRSTLEGGGDDGAPPHAEVFIRNIGAFRRERSATTFSDARWLFAEAWWAESFPTPSYAQICVWAVDVLPWIVIAHVDRQIRRAGFRFSQAPTLWEEFVTRLVWVLRCVSLLLAILIAPILVALVLGMLIIGMLPLPKVREFVGAVQRGIASVLGDSFIFVGKPIARAAILSRVRADLQWITARSDRVAIVAHSQGAAIVHELLRSTALARCDYLFTFGSGLRKLTDVRQAADSKETKFTRLAISAFWLLGAAVVLTLVMAPPAWKVLAILPFIVWLGATSWSLSMWRVRTTRLLDQKKQWLADRDLFQKWFRLSHSQRYLHDFRWVDVFASADPVPNGPLLDDFLPDEMKTGVVHNHHSLLADHNAYWQNRDDFVARLSWDLLDVAGYPMQKIEEGGRDRQHVAGVRRRWRVTCLRAARYLVTTASIGLLALWWVLGTPDFFLQLVDSCRTAIAEVPIIGKWATGKTISVFSYSGMFIYVLCWLAIYGVNYVTWRIFDEYEMRKRYQRKDYVPFEGWSIAYLGSLVATIVATAAMIAATFQTAVLTIAAITAIACAAVVAFVFVLNQFEWMRSYLCLRDAAGPLKNVQTKMDAEYLQRLESGKLRRIAWAACHLGNFFWNRDPVRAVAEWEYAIELGSVDAAWNLGRFMENRDPQRSAEAYRRGMELGDPVCAWFLGGLYMNQGDTAAAIEVFRHGAYELESPSPICARRLGDIYETMTYEARRICSEAVSKYKDDPSAALLQFVAATTAAGDEAASNARKAYEQGIKLGDIQSYNSLGLMFEMEASYLRFDLRDDHAADLMRLSAESVYRTGLELGAEQSARRLGNLLRQRGDIDGARGAFKLEIFENSIAAFQLAEMEENENEADAALTAYQRCLDIDPSYLEAEVGIGRLLEQSGRHKAAMRSFERVLATASPDRKELLTETILRLARLLLQDGLRDEFRAAEILERGVALESPEAAYLLGEIRIEQQLYYSAQIALEQAKQFGHKDAEAKLRMLPGSAEVEL